MKVTFQRIELKKLFPLAISRGTMASSENLFVHVHGPTGHVGIGELSPATGSAWTAEGGQGQLEKFVAAGRHDASIHEVWERMREDAIDPPAMAAMDVALWDLWAKQCDQPLHRLLGLPLPTVPTSVTIGINPPEVMRERVPKILEITRARCLKIKLGAPEGVEADRENFEAAAAAAKPFAVKLRVDANGGWSLGDAIPMIKWLAERGVDYVEQPLVEGAEAQLPELFQNRALPIFVDESCRFACDVPKVAHAVDGVNLKLMKCGGLTETVRIVAAARAHGLKTMIGCMSESSVAIAAGASIGAFFDHIDLDSHLNLDPDPAGGLLFVEGVVTPRDVPGHGAYLYDAT